MNQPGAKKQPILTEECTSNSWTIFEWMPLVKKACCFKSGRLPSLVLPPKNVSV
jgi:hypothetical protein